jgi:hypothetical protein
MVDDSAKTTVYVCYGFCEGPRIGRHLITALEAAGFQVVKDPNKAVIFIGHSGGCLRVPRSASLRLAVLIGIPYWPGRTLIGMLWQKNRHEYVLSRENGSGKQWWRKLYWNGFYFWNMSQNVAMWRALTQGLQKPSAGKTLCIRNRNDDCCTPSIWQHTVLNEAAFVSLRGEHDDLWMHPEAYAAMIKTYYGANVLAPSEAK